MVTSTNNIDTQVRAKNLRFENNILHILLSDGREISLPIDQMDWLKWLAKATPEQRAKWAIEPGDLQFTGKNWMTGSRSCTYSVCSRWRRPTSDSHFGYLGVG